MPVQLFQETLFPDKTCFVNTVWPQENQHLRYQNCFNNTKKGSNNESLCTVAVTRYRLR